MKLIFATILSLTVSAAFSQQVTIKYEELGSGVPESNSPENAVRWDNDIFHAPQYLPGYPTSASLWPRLVDVLCAKHDKILTCDGYHWTPDLGRGEYLMIHPVIKQESTENVTTIIEKVPVIVLKEVPVKKKGE